MTAATGIEGQDAPSGPVFPPARQGWTAVVVLALMYCICILDRFALPLLVAPIRKDLGITDFEFSLLTGLAFATAFALAGLPFGWALDRFGRRACVWTGTMVWSLATVGCGASTNFMQLFVSRIVLGAGESVINPGAYSLLADFFPKHKLSSAIAIYSMGASVGGLLAFGMGGMLIDYLDAHRIVLPLIGEIHPWQAVFFIFGPIGVIAAQTLWLFPEPPRQGAKVAVVRGGLLAYALSHKRFLLLHAAGYACIFTIIGSFQSWTPAYMTRAFGWSATTVGFVMGINIFSGLIAFFASGKAADWMLKRGMRDAPMRFSLIASAVALPVAFAAYVVPNPVAFVILSTLLSILVVSSPALAGTAIQLATPNVLRGRLTAGYLLVCILIGQAGGPMITSAISDFLFRDESKIGLAIAITCAGSYLVAIPLLWLGLKPMREAAAELEH